MALPWNDIRGIELIRERLRNSPLPVQLLPDQKVRSLVVNPSFSVNGSFSVGIQRAPLSKPEQFAKRLLDIALASVALVINRTRLRGLRAESSWQQPAVIAG